jgi:hypothetical protein
MAFFSEIKARLGLDITPFEKGLSQAQGSIGKVVDGATGKLGNLKMLGTTLATALGLNLQTIAEGVARMVVGFSKDQEDALLKLAERSAAVADEMEKTAMKRRGGDDPTRRKELLNEKLIPLREDVGRPTELTQKEKNDIMFSKRNFFNGSQGRQEINDEEARRVKAVADAHEKITKINSEINAADAEIRDKTEKLNKDTAKTEEEARLKILSIDEKIAEARAKIAEPAPAKTADAETDNLKIAEQANNKAKARADILDLEKKKQDEIDTAAKATAKVREDALNETLTLEEQILAAKDKVNESEQAAYESKAGVDQANAELTLAQDRANLAKLERDKSKKQADLEKQQQAELDSDEQDFTDKQAAAEKKRTDELDTQLKKLQDQKTTIEQTLAAQAKSAKASIEDIASGKRNVGGTTQSNAKALLRARSEEQRRIDAVSQAEDTLANGGRGLTGGAKDAAQAELNRRKKALAETLGRKGELEGALKDKTSDTLAAEQVVELQTINTTLDDIKAALAATSITSNT